jgi:hypothetical protein
MEKSEKIDGIHQESLKIELVIRRRFRMFKT